MFKFKSTVAIRTGCHARFYTYLGSFLVPILLAINYQPVSLMYKQKLEAMGK